MSEENVAIFRRGYAAVNRGDIDGLLVTVHPDVEFKCTCGRWTSTLEMKKSARRQRCTGTRPSCGWRTGFEEGTGRYP
jgi:ketosteroid isomerase-like protein